MKEPEPKSGGIEVPNVAARFKIVSKIGSGSSGDIYRAQDGFLEREVALKVLPKDSASNHEARERFIREAKALARCDQHPGIVRIFDVVPDPQPYIVMELIDGPSLNDAIQQLSTTESRLRALKDIGSALEYAHSKKIIHRDLSPNNVLLPKSGNAKVIDFGWTKDATGKPITESNLGGIGTLNYISPEQVKSSKHVDHRTDIFSFGCLMYFIFTQEHPGPGAQLSLPKAPWSRGVEDVYSRCVDPNPESRFASMSEVLAALALIRPTADSGIAPISVPFAVAQYLKSPSKKVFSSADVELLLQHIKAQNVRDHLYFQIIATTALRQVEALHLRCADVHDGYLTYEVRKSARKHMGKVQISNELNVLLMDWIKGKKKSDWLFPGRARMCVIKRPKGAVERICEGRHADYRSLQAHYKTYLLAVKLWKHGVGIECLRGFRLGEFYRTLKVMQPNGEENP
jgi:serine/threonine protein kinase